MRKRLFAGAMIKPPAAVLLEKTFLLPQQPFFLIVPQERLWPQGCHSPVMTYGRTQACASIGVCIDAVLIIATIMMYSE